MVEFLFSVCLVALLVVSSGRLLVGVVGRSLAVCLEVCLEVCPGGIVGAVVAVCAWEYCWWCMTIRYRKPSILLVYPTTGSL